MKDSSGCGYLILIVLALALMGFLVENVIFPIWYMIASIISFLMKWAFIIGIPVYIIILVFGWVSSKFKNQNE